MFVDETSLVPWEDPEGLEQPLERPFLAPGSTLAHVSLVTLVPV